MSTGSEPPGGGADKAPFRPTSEVLSDLERERTGLVDAIDRLRAQAQSAKERLPTKRLLMMAGGALLAMVVVRRALRRRRERRLVARIAAAVREPD